MIVVRAHTLDARTLEPPEPFVKACAILQEMKQGEFLHMFHRRMPYPLFDYCKTHQLSYQIVRDDDSGCELIVYFESDADSLMSEGML